MPTFIALLLVCLPVVAAASDPVGERYRQWESGDHAAPIPGSWRFLGPTNFVSGAAPEAVIGGMGRVLDVAVDPTDPASLWVATAGSGVWKRAGGGAWQTVGGGRSWIPLTNDLKPVPAVSSVAIDPENPGTIYALTGRGIPGNVESVPSSGVLKTIDGGASWAYLSLPWRRGVAHYAQKVVVNPPCDAVFVVSWSKVPPDFGGIFRSRDGGESWQRMEVGQAGRDFLGSFRDLEIHPSDPSVMYASTDQNVIRFENCGDTWKDLNQEAKGLPTPKYTGSERVELAVSPASSDTVYALYAGATGFAGIYRSDDRGETFTLRSNLPNILALDKFGMGSTSIAWFALGFAVSPCDAEEIHAGSYNAWRSKDGGRTWSRTSYWQQKDADTAANNSYLHIDIQRLVFIEPVGGCRVSGSAGVPSLYALSDGGISESVDGAESWRDLSANLAITEVYQLCGSGSDLDVLYAGCQDIGTNRLLDGVATHVYWGDGAYCMIHPEEPETVYVSYQWGRLFKSVDGARSFVERTPPSPLRLKTGGRLAILWPFILEPGKPDTIYGCYPGELWQSKDGGENWSELGAALPQPGQRCVGLAVSDGGKEIFVAKPQHVSRYLADSGSWQDVTPPNLPPETTISSIDIFDLRKLLPQLVVITGSTETGDVPLGAYVLYERSPGKPGPSRTSGILHSRDKGATWQENYSKGLPDVPANTLYLVNQIRGKILSGLYLGMDAGVYHSSGGESEEWQPLGEVGGGEGQLPAVPVMAIDYQTDGTRSRLRVGTLGQGIWEFVPEPVSPTSPSVSGKPSLEAAKGIPPTDG